MLDRLVRAIVLVAVLGIVGGCFPASRPQRVDTISSITGRWVGELADRGGAYPITITLREDGTWEGVSLGQRFHGVTKLVDGKVHLTNLVTGVGTTYTLFESDGQLVLRGLRDDGFVAGRLKPVP